MLAPSAQWDILKQDLRHTVRTLTRARGFALTAILVTALGVGANTAAFSVADFVLFRPLPFPDSDALMRLCEGPPTGGGWGCMNQLSPANYRDLKSMSASFENMGVFTGDAVNLVGGGEPRRLASTLVTPEVLPVLGVRPLIGRVFGPGDDEDISSAVISYGLWQSQFGGNPGVLGQKVNLNGAPFTIIGVMPRAFYFPTREVQMWTRLTFRNEDFEDRTNSYIEAVGRLKPGVTFEQARAELVMLAARLARDYPETNEDTGVSFFRMRDYMSPRTRLMLMSLSGAGLCLLLLTCANLANLLLARAAAHERELALRAALGAGRARLMRQLITQSFVLALAGGVLGIAIAFLTLPLFSTLVPPTLPVATRPSLDLRMLGVAALFTGLTALGFGIFPALRAGREEFNALRDNSRAGGGRKQRSRAVLVTIEVTMSVILLITSGLLIRAVWRVQSIDPGFAPEHVLTIKTALPRPEYRQPGTSRAVLRSRADRRARAPRRAERGIHQRPADDHDRIGHQRRGRRPGSARRTKRVGQPPLGHLPVLQVDGHSPSARTRHRKRRHGGSGLGRRREQLVRRTLLARAGPHRQDIRPPRCDPDHRRRGRRRQSTRPGTEQRAADVPARAASARDFPFGLRSQGSGDSALGSERTARVSCQADRACSRSAAADFRRPDDG